MLTQDCVERLAVIFPIEVGRVVLKTLRDDKRCSRLAQSRRLLFAVQEGLVGLCRE